MNGKFLIILLFLIKNFYLTIDLHTISALQEKIRRKIKNSKLNFLRTMEHINIV